jgi:PAS domain S-box-containing protein
MNIRFNSMSPRVVLWTLLIAILVSTAAFAQSDTQPAGMVVLNDRQDMYPLGRYLEILRDPSGELTIQDVTSTAYKDKFILSQVDTPNFGYQSAAYWVRFRVQNQAASIREWVLELAFSNMQYLDLFLPSPDGAGYLEKESGVLRPNESRDFPFHNLAFNLVVPLGSEQTVYIRAQNKASMTLPLILWSSNAFTEHMLKDQLFFGAFYGILLLMLLYNSILNFLIEDRAYLYLVLFIFSLGGTLFFYDGFAFQFFQNMSPGWSISTLAFFLGITFFSTVKFVDVFLDLKTKAPKLHSGSNILATAGILTTVMALFLEYQVVIRIQAAIIIITFIIILGLSVYFSRSGYRQARYLLISWIWFFAGGVLVLSVRMGILPSTPLTEDLIRIGLVWMLAVWSLALANRVNSLKAETEIANRQLRASESRLSQFLEAMPVSVVVYGTDMKPRYVNRETRQLLTNPAMGIFPDLKFRRTLEQTSKYYSFQLRGTGQAYPLERLPAMQALGGVTAAADDIELVIGERHVPVESWANPLFDSEGKVDGVIVAFRDVSERLRKDALLLESQEIRRLALEGAKLGIWSIDLASGEVMWDSRTREIFGVAPDEPATLELGFGLIHPEDREKAQKAFEQAIAPQSNGTYAEEKRIVHPNGQVRWISTSGKAVFESQAAEHRAIRLVGIVMDVTERMKAEQALLESEIRYRRLVETMNEGLAVSDENDRYTYINPRLAEMLGYSTDEMIGHPAVDFFDEENRGLLAEQLARRRLGEKQPYTITWRCKDGSELPTLVAPAAVFNAQGKFQRSIAVVTDISEQVKASQLLEQRVAERTNELSTLLEVTQVVVGTLELKPLLKVILEELQSVIDFDGAAIISLEDQTLTSLKFPLKISDDATAHLTYSISTSLSQSERFRRDEAIIIADVQANTQEGRAFRGIASPLIDITSTEMRAWMGVPLKVKEKLVGVLSIHHHQPDYYTPTMAQLAHAFANQAAVAIENAQLYRQAQAAAAAKERGRLARELHDSVTQALYSLTLYADAGRLSLAAGKTEAAEKNFKEVLSIAREGMGDLRLLIFELRPPVLEEEGLVGALQARLEAVESRAGCQTEFHVEGEPNLSPEVETELYWVVHEVLNNVLKHAKADHVYLDLQFHNSTSKITVRDDGVGFDSSDFGRLSGIGFKNIAERVERIGGSFKIESKCGQGTFFEVELTTRKYY